MPTVDNTDNTLAIRLTLEVTREPDGSFSISLEDEHYPEESDERYPGGLSEGLVFDPAEAAKDAAWVVQCYLENGHCHGRPNEVGAIERIAVPMEFKAAGE